MKKLTTIALISVYILLGGKTAQESFPKDFPRTKTYLEINNYIPRTFTIEHHLSEYLSDKEIKKLITKNYK